MEKTDKTTSKEKKESLSLSSQDGEEIVVEYNHLDYADLVGPLNTPLVKSVPAPSVVPKMPGYFPAIAVFAQEQKGKLVNQNQNYDNKVLGEKWRGLTVSYQRITLMYIANFSLVRGRSTRIEPDRSQTLGSSLGRKTPGPSSIQVVEAGAEAEGEDVLLEWSPPPICRVLS